MIVCSFCPRKFSKHGFQEQMSQLKVHVLARHPHEAALKHPNDWYREEDRVEEPKPEGDANRAPSRDAGDVATKAKWELGAHGVLVVVMDAKGNAHIGVSGLSPAQAREMACAAIHGSFVATMKAQQGPGVKIIGS